MRLLSSIAIAMVTACIGIHVDSAAAQSFDERWSIIPRAKAEPAPQPDQQVRPDAQAESPIEAQPTPERPVARPSKGGFSGKASFYAYRTGKTASGSSFNRNSLTAAHRNLPFGTRVRVTDLATSKSVMVVITDRGPRLRGRVIDLSLGAARSLGITDRGVVRVRGEVL
jgi:rare lipoprotein A (peptidoglycan hydrolase)